ncbi:MAG: ykuD [Phycisphaerales bacterium]|nr:ykuD [Phycisphaerales bacterium]
MPRRNRYTRPLILAVGTIAVVGLAAGGYKKFAHASQQSVSPEAIAQATTQPNAAPNVSYEAVTPANAAGKPEAKLPTPKPASSSLAQSPSSKTPGSKTSASDPTSKHPVFLDAPTTRPSLAIASRPMPTTPVDAPSLFKAVDAKIAAEDLITARDELVSSLDAKKFSDTEREAAYERLSKIADVVVFSPRKFISDTHQLAHTVVKGDNLQKVANLYDVTVGFVQRVNNISDPRKVRLGASLKIIKGPFYAVVNKTAFTLDLYQGDPNQSGAIFLKRLRVGLGEHDSTPTGLWKIGTKLTNPTYYNSRDTGPRIIPANDPTNPLGERWLALEGISGQAAGKESYGIHGTIDPTSIGQKKSMGCVRLLNEDVNLVYDMLIKDKSQVTVVE